VEIEPAMVVGGDQFVEHAHVFLSDEPATLVVARHNRALNGYPRHQTDFSFLPTGLSWYEGFPHQILTAVGSMLEAAG
jgi:hypothetical protein